MPTRDQVFLNSFGSPPPTIAVSDANRNLGRVLASTPDVDASLAQAGVGYYIGINPEIAKSYVIHPTSQGQRAAIASRQSMMFDPRNSPARSQMSEGYTDPIQVFASSNTWQTASGQSSKGKRPSQPSTKFASPFANLPIATRMPWDL